MRKDELWSFEELFPLFILGVEQGKLKVSFTRLTYLRVFGIGVFVDGFAMFIFHSFDSLRSFRSFNRGRARKRHGLAGCAEWHYRHDVLNLSVDSCHALTWCESQSTERGPTKPEIVPFMTTTKKKYGTTSNNTDINNRKAMGIYNNDMFHLKDLAHILHAQNCVFLHWLPHTPERLRRLKIPQTPQTLIPLSSVFQFGVGGWGKENKETERWFKQIVDRIFVFKPYYFFLKSSLFV